MLKTLSVLRNRFDETNLPSPKTPPLGSVRSRFPALLALLPAISALISCQSTSVTTPVTTLPLNVTASFNVSDSARVPDNLTWVAGSDSGQGVLTCSPTSCSVALVLHKGLRATDTVYLRPWVLGVRLVVFPFVSRDGSSTLELVGRQPDDLDIALIDGFAQLRQAKTDSFGKIGKLGPANLVTYYAQRLLAQDPVYAGFPKTLPVGFNADTVKQALVLLSTLSGNSVDRLVNLNLGLDTAAVRRFTVKLLQSGNLQIADTLALLHPVRLTTALTVSQNPIPGGGAVGGGGEFSWNRNRSYSSVQSSVHTSTGSVDNDVSVNFKTPPSATDTDLFLTNNLTILAGSTAAPGIDTLTITLKTDSGYSATARAVFRVGPNPTAPTPTISPAPGNYAPGLSVSIAGSGSIYYTTDGSAPTTASTPYAGAFTVSQNSTVQAIAAQPGVDNSPVAKEAFTFDPVAPPAFAPGAGAYVKAQSVSLVSTTAGATVYYTINGSTPTTGSTVYSTAIPVSTNTTIKAFAVKGSASSSIASAAYTFDTAKAPTFSPAGATFNGSGTVTLASTFGTTIYFTTNGTDPTSASTPYSAPISVTSNITLRAIAIAPGKVASPIISSNYIVIPLTADAPTINPPAGHVATVQKVNLTTTTAGATIYYTTDGTAPTTSSSVYSAAFPVAISSTVKALAVKTGFTSSPISSATYVFDTTSAPTYSPAGGTFQGSLNVKLASATPGATIYYTTDGSNPTTASSVYSGPIPVASNTQIKAIAAAPNSINSSVQANSYSLQLDAPGITPAGASFIGGTTHTITLSATNDGVELYYTTNGSTPTGQSTHYVAPFTIEGNATAITVKSIAFKSGWTPSNVSSEIFQFSATSFP